MKKLLLSITAFAAFGAVKAQTNLDLETWVMGNPTGWTTTNQIYTPATVTQDAGNVSGSCAKIVNDSVASLQNGAPDTTGFMIQVIDAGSTIYTSLKFDYKTAYVGTSDTGIITVGLWDNGRPAVSLSLLLQPTPAWVSVPDGAITLGDLYDIAATNGVDTDSVYVLVSASSAANSVRGNTVFIDNILLDASSASVYELFSNTDVNVYPNPANNIVNFELSSNENVTVNIFSVDGALVKTVDAFQQLTAVDVNDLENGSYVYRVATLNGNIIKTGKFIKQ